MQTWVLANHWQHNTYVDIRRDALRIIISNLCFSMLYSRAVAPCAREVCIYGANRVADAILLRGWPVSVALIHVVNTRILTCRIRSPTLAAFSLITLTERPQYFHQRQLRQKLTDRSSLSSGRVKPL
jgi:hypothetical protein